MTYRDITFCCDWRECKHGRDCRYAMTQKVWRDSYKAGEVLSMVKRRECFEKRQGAASRLING